MSNSGKESFAEGRYSSRNLGVDLPEQLEFLTRSHRSFSARAAQELHRAERYRQYLSLIIVRGGQADLAASDGPYEDMTGPMADLASAIRVDCRTSDLVSGVERGDFAILLVETGPEGAQRFIARLNDNINSLFSGDTSDMEDTKIPIEIITFPDQNSNSTSLANALNDMYRQSSTRPHLS